MEKDLCMKSLGIRSFSSPYLPVFSPNEGKYGPEKLLIRILFTQWISSQISFQANVFYTIRDFQGVQQGKLACKCVKKCQKGYTKYPKVLVSGNYRLRRNQRFSSSKVVTFNLCKSEGYLEPNRTSMMKFFCKNQERLKVVIFAKRVHRRCSTEL